MPPLAQCEHPAAPPEYGEYLVSQVLATLVSNPDVWAQTVLLVTYDENGGFFDHVPPVTAPPGTAGEYLTASPLPADARRHRRAGGPRVPGARAGRLAVRPGRLPVLGDLRPHVRAAPHRDAVRGRGAQHLGLAASATGDLTGALQIGRAPDAQRPRLPQTSLMGDSASIGRAVLDALSGLPDGGNSYRIPAVNPQPAQETLPARPAVP